MQLRNRWSITYHGVPLPRMNRRLLYDVLFSLQLPVWDALKEPVVVHLPEPVGHVTTEFWTAYHGTRNVSFAGQHDHVASYSPILRRRRVRLPWRDRHRRVAVSFGGGKDSTLAHQVLLGMYGRRHVVLLHLVQHFSTMRAARRETLRRSLRTILAPTVLRERCPTQMVSTDFLAVLRSGSAAPRPHVTLYTAAMLPALVHQGVHEVVFSRTALGYRVEPIPSSRERRFANPSGRPERLEHLSRYCGRVLGWELHSESTHQAVGEFVSFDTVLQRFPKAFDRIVMCTRTRNTERFCHDCPKCLEFSLMGMAHGHLAPDLDYDQLFTSSTVRRLVLKAQELGNERLWHGAGPYVSEIGTASHFATFCHTLHLVDPEDARWPLGATAREHVRVLRATWGPVPFPAVARVDPAAAATCGQHGRAIAAVAAAVYPSTTSLTYPDADLKREHLLLVGNDRARLDPTAVMATPGLDAWAQNWGLRDDTP